MTRPPLTDWDKPAADPDASMPTEMEQYDTLVANLKRQLARGGMSYAEAVVVDDIISILAVVRSQTGKEPKTSDRDHRR